MIHSPQRLAPLFLLATGCLGNPAAPKIFITPVAPTTTDDLVAEIQGGNLSEFEFRWFVQDEVRLDQAEATVPASETAKGQVWKVLVSQKEGNGWTPGVAEVEIANTPPVIDSIAFDPESPQSHEDFALVVEASDVDGDAITLESTWTVDDEPALSEGDEISSTATENGQVWQVVVTPSDDDRAGDSATATAVIGNEAPVVDSLTVSPSEPDTSTALSAYAVTSDPNGDDVTLTWAWTGNGTELVSETSSQLTSDNFAKGDVITVTATPNDGWIDGEPVTSDPVTIGNAPPIISGLSASPGEIYTNTDVTCIVTTEDPDDDTVSIHYDWFINGPLVATGGNTLDSDMFVKGDLLSCLVTPNDGEQDGTSITSGDLPVLNTAPSLSSVTIGPDPVFEGQTLTAATHFDPATLDLDSSDTVTFFYEWVLNTNSLGASTNALLTSDNFDHMDVVHVIVTAFDGDDYSAQVTSNSVTVANTPPEIQSVTWNTPVLDTDIVAEAVVSGTDADGSFLQYSAQWFVDGFSVQTTANVINNADTLSGGLYFDKGQEVFVTFTANDGTNDSGPSSSSHLTVQNSLPTWSSPTALEPDPAIVTDTLTFTEFAVDPDGDPITYTVDWDIDGTAAGSSQSLDLTTTTAARGQTVTATITPNDGTDNGPSASPNRVISNAPPSVDSVTLWPDPALTTDDLTLSYVVSDPDGDTPTVTYGWLVETLTVGEYSNLLSAGAHAKGNRVEGWIYVDDGVGASNSNSDDSTELIIGNSPPSAPGVAFTNTSSLEGEDLVCQVVTASSDADPLDNLTYLFSWDMNGTPFTGATTGTAMSNTLPGTNTNAGEQWTCSVAASDGTDSSGPASVSVFITKAFTGWNPSAYPLVMASHVFSSTTDNERAGFSVDSAGDIDGDGKADILIGGHGSQIPLPSGSSFNVGRTWLYTGADLQNASGSLALDATSGFYVFDGSDTNKSGYSVSGAGDFDGNGLDDILISEPVETYTSGASYAGVVHLFTGESLSGGGTASLGTYNSPGPADHTFYGTTANGYAGHSVDGGGDVDGDGLGDLLIGSPNAANGATGEAHLILSGDAAQYTTSWVSLDSVSNHFVQSRPGWHVGEVVSFAGDVDGDGLTDVLLGAPDADYSHYWGGAGYLMLAADIQSGTVVLDLFNSGTGSHTIYASALILPESGATYGNLGTGISGAGDIDADGYDDIAIGAINHFAPNTKSGAAYIVLASTLNGPTGPLSASATTPVWSLTNADYRIAGRDAYQHLGVTTASAGDVDGDGQGDVMIGAMGGDHDHMFSKALLYLGSNLTTAGAGSYDFDDPSILSNSFTESDGNASHFFAGAGDVNADGLDDLLIGAPGVGTDRGQAYLLFAP